MAAVSLVAVTPVASADIVIGGCTVVDNPTPENHAVCPGLDLPGSDLTGLDLSYADLTGANLNHADLTGTKLTGANLAEADMLYALLTDSDLAGANLTGAYLYAARVVNANFTDANLTGANLTALELYWPPSGLGANFTDANLTGANLDYVKLAGAVLTGANLTGARLTDGTDLTDTMLIPTDTTATADESGNATVTWPTPPNLTGTTFGSCDRASDSSFPVGTNTVRCSVNTSAGQARGNFTVTVRPQLSPSIWGDPSEGKVGFDYYFEFGIEGSPTPTVTTTSELPAGLTLSEEGVLSGTPTEAGSFPITITASNSAGDVDERVTVRIKSETGSLGSGSLRSGSLGSGSVEGVSGS
ncbi:pentapeptide repeat-containing protein [Rhodococcus marinonascens]|uniref:pentapeptide repeat-containing protein n=1 Tax=Rhodococcus marinonascens TaxID=38311 RepID=UPI000934B6EB|nr:pentapeptide repeat-containing protein [Rhodococcus marinonascens]